ncbi:maleylpyruvate isomerase family mycothiol-dependent enzyme [Nostocoides veronense]|uniref:TIGR03084 family metal-binding protein n=1 Tax=Nostocoides veronense TaxID=330836 RepID=A0ABP4XI93_9MICO
MPCAHRPDGARVGDNGGVDVYADLAAEEEQLAALLDALPPEDWRAPSRCAGWTVTDVVLHLAQCEEAVVGAVTGGTAYAPVDWTRLGNTVETAMDAYVETERADAQSVRRRWESARVAALGALRAADPKRKVQWVTNLLRPTTLATTRLAEHWAHALDIAEPLGRDHPDTARLRHILWLAHATLPYACAVDGRAAPVVRIEATGPVGEHWAISPEDADVVLSGGAGELCRIGARRLDPAASSVTASGPGGAEVLSLLRTFAV